jgi:bifunctional non-homologous end joining protein LigD
MPTPRTSSRKTSARTAAGAHPSKTSGTRRSAATPSRAKAGRVDIPDDRDSADVRIGDRTVSLTNLRKEFWPDLGITKGDLLRYYTAVAPVLLPHLRDRAMVMKRYPNGIAGKFFFMKRAPEGRPDWIETCSIEHDSGNIIDFPMVQDLASLLWVVNLGCIDLNEWYARCDDVDRPDYLHFDLDPVPNAGWDTVVEAALLVRDALDAVDIPSHAKTSGSKGIHVYIPIERGPTQKEVWAFAKEFALTLASSRPKLVTAEYRVAKRPRGRVLVDYNQNAWGRTLASVYSVRPRAIPGVSMPVTWDEIERGIAIEDFRIDNAPARIAKVGDLWKPVLARSRRFKLAQVL